MRNYWLTQVKYFCLERRAKVYQGNIKITPVKLYTDNLYNEVNQAFLNL